MKSLYIILALLGQFQVEELALSPNQPGTFIVEELQPIKPQPLPEKKLEEKPEFELLSAPWCGACQSVKQALNHFGKEKLPFTYSVSNVDSRGWLGASSIPAWVYKGKVFQYGFSTPENLMSNFHKATDRPKQARAVQRLTPSQLKEFARNYRGNPYGVKGGDFYSHLLSGNHGFTVQQLNGLSQSECAKVHAGHHWGYLTPFAIGGK